MQECYKAAFVLDSVGVQELISYANVRMYIFGILLLSVV